MGKNVGPRPRIVCCAVPIDPKSSKVLLITSRKRADRWILPKGGWEISDVTLEAAASREALEEAGVKGSITRQLTTIDTSSAKYHVFELNVNSLQETWLESEERQREWVDYAEAFKRLQWKPELARALSMCRVAPPTDEHCPSLPDPCLSISASPSDCRRV